GTWVCFDRACAAQGWLRIDRCTWEIIPFGTSPVRAAPVCWASAFSPGSSAIYRTTLNCDPRIGWTTCGTSRRRWRSSRRWIAGTQPCPKSASLPRRPIVARTATRGLETEGDPAIDQRSELRPPIVPRRDGPARRGDVARGRTLAVGPRRPGHTGPICPRRRGRVRESAAPGRLQVRCPRATQLLPARLRADGAGAC